MIPHARLEEDPKELNNDEISYDYERATQVKWYDRILLNRPLKVLLALLLLAILTPVLLYRYVFFTSMDLPPSDGYSFGSCLVPRAARITCGPENTTQESCHSQCCYDFDNNYCFQRLPSRFSYIMDRQWAEEVILRPRIATVPFKSQKSISRLRLSIDEISQTHLSLTYYDAMKLSLNGSRIAEKSYEYEISWHELNININGPNKSIFSTIRGPLIASENIWEISFKLTAETMYGLGELPLTQGTVKVLYNNDEGWASLPLIFAKSNGSFHGLLIDVKAPTELSIGSDNQIVLRSITSLGLKLHVFVGPEPKDIMKDVMAVTGSVKNFQYWMLGAHMCSEDPVSASTAATVLRTFITEANRLKLPYDSHCGALPLYFKAERIAAEVTAVTNGARLVTNARKKHVPHVYPYIRYTAEDKNATSNVTCTDLVCKYEELMLRTPDKIIYRGYVSRSESESVVYPDYRNISEEFINELWMYTATFDGAFLLDNWPVDESPKNYSDARSELPYFNQNFEGAFKHTPPWNILNSQEKRYFEEHNDYANNFIEAFEIKSQGKPIVTASQWMNTGIVMNRQNVPTSWTNLRRELVQAALGGISGHWLWSSPICGDTENFNNDIHTNLCIKWYMAATYMPMISIRSRGTRRDAGGFVGTHRSLIMDALNKRLMLLPYYYTVLNEGPLLRPMFYQYPSFEPLHDLSNQFSVGDHLLIAPNLQPSQSHVHIRMPPGVWYELWSGLRSQTNEGEILTMTTTEADFITLIKGGSILVIQKDVTETALNTQKASDFSLIVATDVVKPDNGANATLAAKGHLYMSKNMTIHFKMADNKVVITSEGDDFDVFCATSAAWAKRVKEINVYGLDDAENNFDFYKRYSTSIDLCDLKNGEIVYLLVSSTHV